MAKKNYTPEQIISKLREVEILLSQGKTQDQAVRSIGVTSNTYYRWRKEYGGMGVGQVSTIYARIDELHGRSLAMSMKCPCHLPHIFQ